MPKQVYRHRGIAAMAWRHDQPAWPSELIDGEVDLAGAATARAPDGLSILKRLSVRSLEQPDILL